MLLFCYSYVYVPDTKLVKKAAINAIKVKLDYELEVKDTMKLRLDEARDSYNNLFEAYLKQDHHCRQLEVAYQNEKSENKIMAVLTQDGHVSGSLAADLFRKLLSNDAVKDLLMQSYAEQG